MKKAIVYFQILLIFSVFTSCLTVKKNNKNFNEITLTAQKELSQTLKKIPVGYEDLYGFRNKSEIENAEIGNPFEFYKLENEELKKTSSFRVPIIVDGEFRALATIEYIGDTYHIVDFGSTVLANEIQKVCRENPKMSFAGILRLYDIFSDFMVMSKKQDYIFVPLTSAKIYLKTIGISNPESCYSKNQIIQLLKNK